MVFERPKRGDGGKRWCNSVVTWKERGGKTGVGVYGTQGDAETIFERCLLDSSLPRGGETGCVSVFSPKGKGLERGKRMATVLLVR